MSSMGGHGEAASGDTFSLVTDWRAALAAIEQALGPAARQDKGYTYVVERAIARLRDGLLGRRGELGDTPRAPRLEAALRHVEAALASVVGLDRVAGDAQRRGFEQAREQLLQLDEGELRALEAPVSGAAAAGISPAEPAAADAGRATIYPAQSYPDDTTRAGIYPAGGAVPPVAPGGPGLRPAVPVGTSQVFHRAANTFARASIIGGLLLIVALGVTAARINTSSYKTIQGVSVAQPVPFSHQHHYQQLGIDCRYCHTSVETSAFAGIPPTETCMTCHSQIWNQSPMLQPVRDSYATGRPIEWNRVHDLPDFVYFNHSIHVSKGVGCSTCHGRVQEMPLVRKVQPLNMAWCLNCHSEPEKYLRPVDQVFNMEWTAPPNQLAQGRELLKTNHVNKEGLLNCTICHR
jgi:hypothetical protein